MVFCYTAGTWNLWARSIPRGSKHLDDAYLAHATPTVLHIRTQSPHYMGPHEVASRDSSSTHQKAGAVRNLIYGVLGPSGLPSLSLKSETVHQQFAA